MNEKESHKKSVIFLPYAIIYPNAMMVKFFYAMVTDPAVLRPGRFFKFASFALRIFDVHRVIKNVFSIQGFLVFFRNFPRITVTHFYE